MASPGPVYARSPAELEAWGLKLLERWGYFDQPEPRLAPYRWMAPLCRLFKVPSSIYHFRLGEAKT